MQRVGHASTQLANQRQLAREERQYESNTNDRPDVSYGDTETALQMYAGAFDEPSGAYAAKVLAERARLEPLRQKARKPQSV